MSNWYFNDIKYSLNDNKSFHLLEVLATTHLEGKFNEKHYHQSQRIRNARVME